MHFNPRSRKESDRTYSQHGVNASGFQSTLSQGERHPDNLPPDGRVHISIHALARRATIAFCQLLSARGDFNPRSRKESDALTVNTASTSVDFNPRSRKESDVASTRTRFSDLYFNPRSRKESDLIGAFIMTGLETFQSTLSQGERLLFAMLCSARQRFQSTLSQGERLRIDSETQLNQIISIHALARRAT